MFNDLSPLTTLGERGFAEAKATKAQMLANDLESSRNLTASAAASQLATKTRPEVR
jgi:hypothetical protein